MGRAKTSFKIETFAGQKNRSSVPTKMELANFNPNSSRPSVLPCFTEGNSRSRGTIFSLRGLGFFGFKST